MNIAYFVPLFPSVSLTFIAREVRELEKLNSIITVFAYEKADMEFIHPEFSEIKAKVIYSPSLRGWQIAKILWANASMVITNPQGYLKAFSWLRTAPDKNRLEGWKSLLRAGYFSYLARKLSIERIHAHFALDWTITAMLTSWMVNIPFSITTHAADIFTESNSEILPHLFAKIDFLVTISQYNRKFLLDRFPDVLNPKCIFVVHCGIDLKEFEFTPHLYTPRNRLSIATVARLIEKKGHSVLIEALRILKEQDYDFRWTVVGQGQLLRKLEELIKKTGLKENVEFVGAATRDELQAKLRAADVMVLPCIQAPGGDMDGIPVALMEAMAMGLPVISTNISGIPELITAGETGLLVPPNDSMALAEAMRHLWENPTDLQQMVINAREKIRAEFNIEVEGSQLLEIFRNARYKESNEISA